MKYAYVRVSTASQNIDRQMEEMFRQDIEFKNIFIDYQSGKDFERKNYQKLIKRLKKDDLLVIKSIDRLGRDYNMILEEWQKGQVGLLSFNSISMKDISSLSGIK